MSGEVTRNAGEVAPMPGVWTTRGFEAFRQGSFGDAGKNLYVSRVGDAATHP